MSDRGAEVRQMDSAFQALERAVIEAWDRQFSPPSASEVDVVMARIAVRNVLTALLTMPAEKRMELIGMVPAVSWGRPIVITHYHDAGELERGIFPHHRTAYVEACARRVGADHADHEHQAMRRA